MTIQDMLTTKLRELLDNPEFVGEVVVYQETRLRQRTLNDSRFIDMLYDGVVLLTIEPSACSMVVYNAQFSIYARRRLSMILREFSPFWTARLKGEGVVLIDRNGREYETQSTISFDPWHPLRASYWSKPCVVS